MLAPHALHHDLLHFSFPSLIHNDNISYWKELASYYMNILMSLKIFTILKSKLLYFTMNIFPLLQL